MRITEDAKRRFDDRCLCDTPVQSQADRCPRCGRRYAGRTWTEFWRDAVIAAMPSVLLAGVVQQSRASREAVMTTSVTHVQVLEIRHLFLEVFGTAHGDRRNARAKVLQLAKAGELAESCVRDLGSI